MAIGEYLMHAKQTLAHGKYELMIRSRLPFNTSAAHKMRAVAEAVHNGRIPRVQLPHNYAAAYELTLVSDQEFQVATHRGLVHPDVYLPEIQALRAELRSAPRRAALVREKEPLIPEIERIRARMNEIEVALQDEARGELLIIDGEAERVENSVSFQEGPS